MRVRELIEKLQAMDPEAVVFRSDYEDPWLVDVDEVKIPDPLMVHPSFRRERHVVIS